MGESSLGSFYEGPYFVGFLLKTSTWTLEFPKNRSLGMTFWSHVRVLYDGVSYQTLLDKMV